MTATYRVWGVGLNPEPWAMGKPTMIYNPKTKKHWPKYSPNRQLKAYQDAVRAELQARDVQVEPGMYRLRFTFSRQLEIAVNRTSTSTSHVADTTNMQKATEDALQGVAIGNDRDVIDVGGRLAGPQMVSTVPYVIIEVWSQLETYELDPPLGDPAQEELKRVFQEFLRPEIIDNTWEP
ncbi:RusA-like resolvase [Gordonia phage Benczkowski14]|uniref:RusA-like resolvase n=2 Tax=Demosthenesvirus katyusha TaxID=1982108 RepID=A0A142KCC4_9CAUD|nr:RusA-like Holliday junction resolvase [Gordonia phage Katyusha]AMS03440.1 RusA-like resolvase [Gordonia phage Katyusha]AMS03757.1 RusA-like resolvase [Gordonia phage Benczkowski14]